MIDFDSFFSRPEFQQWHANFKAALVQRVDPKRHGDLSGWLEIINSLPNIDANEIALNQDTVMIGSKGILNRRIKPNCTTLFSH
ncbi:MAG: hypothetical protein JKX81_15580 [Arenicella sp.]|nr:hypothetical protein [Arenicella sp.]